jgi:hypothetical protein
MGAMNGLYDAPPFAGHGIAVAPGRNAKISKIRKISSVDEHCHI